MSVFLSEIAEIFPRRSCGLASEPGVITQRSCAYFGARYVLGPVKGFIHLVHSPVGCAHYGKMVRGRPFSLFTTDLRERDIIYGGVKKLKEALYEAFEIHPFAKGAFIYVTCASGLTGEDVEGVAKEVSLKLKKIIKVVNSPGCLSISQNKGHRVGYEVLLEIIKEVCQNPEKKPEIPTVNIIGEYNVAGETRIIKDLLKSLGIKVNAVFTGDVDFEKLTKFTQVHANLLSCGATAEEFCKKIKQDFGIPFIKVSFYGLKSIAMSLRKVAEFFEIEERVVEELISREEERVLKEIFPLRRFFKNKKALIVLGSHRLGPQGKMLKELGFEVVGAFSLFGRPEDHKEVSKLTTLVSDNPGDREIEELLWLLKPHIVLTNAREQWKCVKLGVPVLPFPQPKEMGPYAGYSGMLNFAKNLYKALKSPVWNLLKTGI